MVESIFEAFPTSIKVLIIGNSKYSPNSKHLNIIQANNDALEFKKACTEMLCI